MKPRALQSVLQSGLCLLLCPLLPAQETVSATPPDGPAVALLQVPVSSGPSAIADGPLPEQLLIPRNRMIQLLILDPVSTATATVGSTIRLAVGQDFAVGGATMLRYGTAVTGTLTEVRRGVAGQKRARLEISVRDISLGKNLNLKLDQNWRQLPGEKAGKVGLWVLAAPLVVIASPFLIAMALEGRSEKPTGEDLAYHACAVRPYYVASDTLISVADLDPAAAGATVPLQDLCPNTKRSSCNESGRGRSRAPLCSSHGPAPTSPIPSHAP